MKLYLLVLVLLISLAKGNSQIVEHCQNGGFIVVNSEGNNECFCHGTGFYDLTCNTTCPPYFNHSSYPIECISI